MRTMFRQILQLFTGTDPLREILDMFASMLEDGRWMYGQVLDIHTGTIDPVEVQSPLFARDRKINAKEREIRRRLVEYLTISDEPDVSSCLILMSVAKDAERVGDYVKNMYDVSVASRVETNTDRDLDLAAHELRARGAPLFDAVRQAFMTSDRSMAEHVLETALALAHEAEEHVWKVAEHETISSRSAVVHALSARHVKRVASHLGNIATAVVQPVDWLNYADEPPSTDAESPPSGEEGA